MSTSGYFEGIVMDGPMRGQRIAQERDVCVVEELSSFPPLIIKPEMLMEPAITRTWRYVYVAAGQGKLPGWYLAA